VNLRTLARYIFGDANAIRTVAIEKNSIWLGIGLVLLPAIARNYDQNFILETPLWLFGPLLFSFFSGTFLFWILRGFVSKHITVEIEEPNQTDSPWRSFMGLFWMTAPVAWLYAIPVERFLTSYHAAVANLTLLAVVAMWRVFLMSRIVEVVHGVPWPRAFGWVLVAASLEVILVVFCGWFFGGGMARSVLASMGGMRHAPEEQLVISALGFIWTGAWIVLTACVVTLWLAKYSGTATPLPALMKRSAFSKSLFLLPIFWIAAAIPAQLEQARFHAHSKLMKTERYEEALAHLSRFERRDFPASRRIEPNPYEYPVWKDLPRTTALLTTNTPMWIREVYLSHLSITFRHYMPRFHSAPDVAAMFSAIARLPQGREWMRMNETELEQHLPRVGNFWDDNGTNAAARTNLVLALRELGMSEQAISKLPDIPTRPGTNDNKIMRRE
jgi:hypothetical protein